MRFFLKKYNTGIIKNFILGRKFKMRKTFLKTLVATAVVGATVALSSAFAFAATYTFNANDLTAGDITANTQAGTDNFFTLKATDTKNSKGDKYAQQFTVDSNDKTGPVTGTKYTQRVKSNGAGTADYRCITFTVDSSATLVLEGTSSSKGNSRNLNVYNSSASDATAVGTLTSDGNQLDGTTLTIDAGTYYIYPDNAFNIYGVVVTTKDDDTATSATGLTKLSNGAVYVTDTDTYVIAGVDSLDADSLSVTVGSTKKATETTDTVYTAVQIGDEKITAEQVGKKYLYAIKLAGANKNKAAETFTVE
jgi:hypothetical protein